MNQKGKLYQATQGSGLSDYLLFNQDSNDKEKNIFLSLTMKALINEEWFKISNFKSLGLKPFKKDITHVPYADKEIKNEEYATLKKVFTKDEIDELIHIIKNMKSYGVNPITELMDEEEPKIRTWMRSAFLSPLFSKK
jgi:hypothetical protein